MPIDLSDIKFKTGFRAGCRHAFLGYTPNDFLLSNKSEAFKAGYRMGSIDFKASKINSDTEANARAHAAFLTYRAAVST